MLSPARLSDRIARLVRRKPSRPRPPIGPAAQKTLMSRLLHHWFPRPPISVPLVYYDDLNLTVSRLVNMHLAHWECVQGRTRVWSRPSKLVIEPVNTCNLECPGCFTGVGENGRERSLMSLDFFKKVLDEQSNTLCNVEFCNWGEPLLHKGIYDLIAEANSRGLTTSISTNFSVPFDEAKAEALVKSGLTHVLVSVDGATQDVYEIYRRRGDLALVFKNVRLLADARARLNSPYPTIWWGYHVFEHNLHELEQAIAMAPTLGFDNIHANKGWVIGEDWDGPPPYGAGRLPPSYRCPFLWHYSVVHNDGGVAPCCASFYREDDMGRLARAPDDGGADNFKSVWNSDTFVGAREYFKPSPAPMGAEENICRSCPFTLNWHASEAHRASGSSEPYESEFDYGAFPTYQFHHRPKDRDTTQLVRPAKRRS